MSSAAAAVLTSMFGDDYSFTAGSEGLAGITRSFASFEAAAAEAGQSRIYGGIHFRFDQEAGSHQGRQVGRYIHENYLRSWDELEDE